jgi:hypothetical protein
LADLLQFRSTIRHTSSPPEDFLFCDFEDSFSNTDERDKEIDEEEEEDRKVPRELARELENKSYRSINEYNNEGEISGFRGQTDCLPLSFQFPDDPFAFTSNLNLPLTLQHDVFTKSLPSTNPGVYFDACVSSINSVVFTRYISISLFCFCKE